MAVEELHHALHERHYPYNEGRRRSTNVLGIHLSVCIISNMAHTDRYLQMSIRLSKDEMDLRDALAKHLGIDHAGVMRMALLRMARAEEISVPDTQKKAVPEGTARRKR